MCSRHIRHEKLNPNMETQTHGRGEAPALMLHPATVKTTPSREKRVEPASTTGWPCSATARAPVP